LKGGEKVQVGGLGFINTLTLGGGNPSTVNGLDFAGLLGSLISNGSVMDKSDSLNPLLNKHPVRI
jgi:hypothetical protein